MKAFKVVEPVVSRRAVLALGALAGGSAGAGGRTLAADYPTRPVRIIVPYAPGGTTDIAARLVADPLSKALGQPVVVENKPGANSIVGAAAAASSPADGHTMVMVLPAHAANTTLQAGKMPFDPAAGFSPVSLVVQAPLVLAGSKRVPARTLGEFLDHAKRNPGEVNYGSTPWCADRPTVLLRVGWNRGDPSSIQGRPSCLSKPTRSAGIASPSSATGSPTGRHTMRACGPAAA